MKNCSFGIYDINEYFDFKTRLDVYKQIGFREIALYIDNSYMKNGENYQDIIDYARKTGLEIKQVHIDYKISNHICDKQSNVYFEYIEEKLKECEKFKIPYMVAHASMGDNPEEVSSEQIEKLKMVAERHKGVTLCFENVRNNKNLEKILNANIKNVKMCFDLGHAHAYSNEHQLFEKYKNKIQCSHLHNNNGKDSHSRLTEGQIDYKYFAKALLKIENCSNCLECFPPFGAKLSLQEFSNFVKNCFDDVCSI